MTIAVSESFDHDLPEVTFAEDGKSFTSRAAVGADFIEATYNALGLEASVRMIHADGRQSLIEHVRDSRGRLAATLFRDGSGSARIFCFNAMERLVTEMIQRGVRTETRTYTYNELGNRVEIARLIIDDDWSFGSQPSVSFNSTEKS